MTITLQPASTSLSTTQRPFSVGIYLLIVFALSWPPQIAYALWGNDPVSGYLLSSLSMVMVAVGTFIAGHRVFRDGFKNMGWRWAILLLVHRKLAPLNLTLERSFQ